MLDVKYFSYRDMSYDMALASCFSALFTSVHREAIESTAHHILALLPEAVLNMDSPELKVSWVFGVQVELWPYLVFEEVNISFLLSFSAIGPV